MIIFWLIIDCKLSLYKDIVNSFFVVGLFTKEVIRLENGGSKQ
jgi:hypothetical protein